MFNNFVLRFAIRYFFARKNEKFVSFISMFSLLGICIGVAALIVVMSVMNGFHLELTKNIVGLNGDISIRPLSSKIDDYQLISTKLKDKPYIKHISYSIQGQALALGGRSNSGVIIRGIEHKDLGHKGDILKNNIAGDFDNFFGKDVIAIGSELAATLGVKINSKLKLISSNSIATAFGSIPRSKEFKVAVIFSSGVYDYDAATILMPLESAQQFLSFSDSINLVEIYTNNTSNSTIFALDINEALNNDFRVVSWQSSNQQFLNALKIERVAMFTILSLIVVVAAFNIISSLFMLVKDKTRDIAILKTIGASTNQIMLIFICNGMITGLIGTVLGVLLGAGFAHNIETIRKFLEKVTGVKIFEAAIYVLYSLPSEVHLQDILFVVTLTLSLCGLATIYPAYKASRLNPVEALRYE